MSRSISPYAPVDANSPSPSCIMPKSAFLCRNRTSSNLSPNTFWCKATCSGPGIDFVTSYALWTAVRPVSYALRSALIYLRSCLWSSTTDDSRNRLRFAIRSISRSSSELAEYISSRILSSSRSCSSVISIDIIYIAIITIQNIY